MVWWFFGKKEGDKWGDLHNTLHKSFSNIKKDIDKVNEWLNEHRLKLDGHEGKHSLNEERISLILSRLDKIEQNLNYPRQKNIIQEKIEEEIDEEIEIPIKTNVLNELTNVQKSLLLRLAILLKESKGKWTSMKSLTQELYPAKGYESVKSMMSNYTDTLLNLGLIEKKRKGKDIFLTITKKADSFLPKETQKVKNMRKKKKK